MPRPFARKIASFFERFRDPVGRYFAQRVPLWLMVWFGLLLGGQRDDVVRGRPGNLFLDGWFRWESLIYLNISKVGYTNIPNELGQRDTHFWPGYPLLVKLAAVPFLGDHLLAAFVLNNLLLLGSVILFEDFARRHVDERVSRLASWLLLIYPFSLYYSAGHTESAVLFFSLLTFYFGYRKHWLAAGIAAAVAGSMRASGVSVGLALPLLYLEGAKWSPKNLRPNVIFACLGVLGPLGFIAFLKLRFNDPLAFTHGLDAKDWGADITFMRLVRVLGALVSPSEWPLTWLQTNDLFHLLCLVVAIGLTLASTRRFSPHVVVFCALTILTQIRLWANAGRYVAPIFPLYVVAAIYLAPRRNLTLFVVTASLLFMGLYAYLYSHAFWVS